jgi:hypothetical protein
MRFQVSKWETAFKSTMYGCLLCAVVTSIRTEYHHRLIGTHNVPYRPIDRQRLDKHIPAGANARNNRTSIARQRISKQAFSTIERMFSAWSVRRGYKGTNKVFWVSCYQKLREFSWRRVHLSQLSSRNGSSTGDGSPRWLRRNGKKGIRRWKEDFMCNLKWQWDCYKPLPEYD